MKNQTINLLSIRVKQRLCNVTLEKPETSAYAIVLILLLGMMI